MSYLTEYKSGVNNNFDLYVQAVHFILTTFTTVGFGDLNPKNYLEVMYLIFLEVIGVTGFSYIMGTIGSIMTCIDIQAALQ